MTPTLGYLLALLVIVFVIDFTLRALPFKILEPLRDSRFVSDMAVWMPPGIMLILVLSTLTHNAHTAGDHWWVALAATGVTKREPRSGSSILKGSARSVKSMTKTRTRIVSR